MDLDETHSARLNWAGTYRYRAPRLIEAHTIEEVRRAVVDASSIRALGTRHSFTGIADSDDTQISLLGIAPDPIIDQGERTVTIGAGVRYGELAGWLQRRGWALHNTGSLPHISIGGAIATGTHGSGDRNGALPTAVKEIVLVDSDGDLSTRRRGEPGFAGSVVSLGALGIVVRVTLDIQPTFRMRQDVYRGMTWSALLDDLDRVTGAGYSVSVFGKPEEEQCLVWVKRLAGDAAPDTLLDGSRDPETRSYLLGGVEGNLTTQGGVEGDWLDMLPHFRLDSDPSDGDEIQSEFFVPRTDGAAAVAAVLELGAALAPHLTLIELRTVAADDLWLSMAFERDSLAIHFTWKNHADAVDELVAAVQRALAPFAPRPHWGKVFDAEQFDPGIAYPRFGEMRSLVAAADPTGKFSNAFIERYELGTVRNFRCGDGEI